LLTGLASLPLLYISITGADYRLKRVLTYLNPWDDPLGSGFQTIQSFLALGRGGLLGLGLGEGRQKLFYLPEPHSDFIFSVIGEELGFVGTVTIIFLFLLIVWRGVKTATRCPDLHGTYLAFGVSVLLGLQALMHMSVATGLLPAKGLTLPFISSGGSSLLMSMMAAGILLNISRRCGYGHA
jgi:cell division protein FtsW